MSSFKRREPVTAGARRIVCAELEKAIQSLSRKQKRDPAGRAADAIASARAAVELVGSALPGDVLRRDRKRLVSIAKTLDTARLGRRLVNRLDALARSAELDPDDPVLKAVRKRLSQDAAGKVALRTAGQRFDPRVYRLVAELAELRGHVGLWPTPAPNTTDSSDADDENRQEEASGPDAPPPGLAGVYRAARTAAARARDDAGRLPDAAAPLHRLAEALSLVYKACPPMIRPQHVLLADTAKPLALVALNATLHKRVTTIDGAADLADALRDAGQPDRDAAASAVAKAHDYALAETPQAFAKRVGAYWLAWRA